MKNSKQSENTVEPFVYPICCVLGRSFEVPYESFLGSFRASTDGFRGTVFFYPAVAHLATNAQRYSSGGKLGVLLLVVSRILPGIWQDNLENLFLFSILSIEV